MAIKHLGANSRGADMTESQDDKYLKHNDHIDLLADATQAKMNLYVGISSGSRLTLGSEDFTENFVFHCRAEPGSPTLDGDWGLVVPATQRLFAVFNDTGFNCSVESAGSPGTVVSVPDGGRALLHNDGETIVELLRDTYDIGFFISSYTEAALSGAFIAVRAFVLPVSLPDSQAYAFTAPDEAVSISVQKNEGEIGTIDFAAGSNSGTFTLSSSVSFAVGDRLRLINGSASPEEGSLANVSIVLKASLA